MECGTVSPSRALYLNSFWNRSDLRPKRLSSHRDEVIDLYDSGVRWVDAQMARLIEALDIGAGRGDLVGERFDHVMKAQDEAPVRHKFGELGRVGRVWAEDR